jgi:hypothetical protein
MYYRTCAAMFPHPCCIGTQKKSGTFKSFPQSPEPSLFSFTTFGSCWLVVKIDMGTEWIEKEQE